MILNLHTKIKNKYTNENQYFYFVSTIEIFFYYIAKFHFHYQPLTISQTIGLSLHICFQYPFFRCFPFFLPNKPPIHLFDNLFTNKLLAILKQQKLYYFTKWKQN